MRYRFRSVLVPYLLLMAVIVRTDETVGQDKAAVPDAEARAAAKKTAAEIYGSRFEMAETAAEKTKLAAEMIDAAMQVTDGSPGQFVLLSIARDIAARAGDATTGLTAFEELFKRFDVPGPKMQAEILLTAGRNASTVAQRKEMAEAAANVVEQLAGAGEFELGLKLCEVARSSAQRAKAFSLANRFAELSKDLERGLERSRDYRAALIVLESDPTDGEANLAAGRYLCFVKGDWDQGTAMLALGSDKELKAAATKDLQADGSAKQQLAVGDAWWDLAETRQGPAGDALRRRAAVYYRKSLAKLDGLDRIKVQQRIEQLRNDTPQPDPDAPVPVAEIHCFQGQNYGAFSPDGQRIVTSGRDNVLRLWDVSTRREIRSFTGHTARARVVRFAPPSGDRIVSLGDDATIRVWDTETGRELNSFNASTRLQGNRPTMLVTSGGKHLVWCDEQKQLRVTDLKTGKTVYSFSIGRGGTNVYVVAFTEDGRWALSGGFENTVRFWSVATGKAVNFDGHTHVYGGALSPDGRLGVTAGGDELVRLWNLSRRVELARYTGHSGDVYAAAISPDRQRILSGDSNGEVRLWDTKTAKELHCYRGHTKPVSQVCFSPDGRYALSSSKDETVRLLGMPE